MALTVKQINSDASFLLSFLPVLPTPRDPLLPGLEPFTVLLDPWISGPSTIFHPVVSHSKLHSPACITSLAEIPEPDLVIISQHRSDHCNEATLRQLPGRGSGSKTLVLAQPAAAKVVRSWKHFDPERVITLHRWDRSRSKETIVRVEVPAVVDGGLPGEVTVAFIAQRGDITALHGSVGITYRPPGLVAGRRGSMAPQPDPIVTTFGQVELASLGNLTPPATPKSRRSSLTFGNFGNGFLAPSPGARGLLSSSRPSSALVAPLNLNNTGNGKFSITNEKTTPPPTPTALSPANPLHPVPTLAVPGRMSYTPVLLRSIRSASTIASPHPSPLSNAPTAVASISTTDSPPTPPKSPLRSSARFSARTLSTILNLASRPEARTHGLNRAVSVIFSPHGTAVSALEDFASHHLIPAAAVPLTLLLHCFDRARNPWLLGGEISLGASNGALAAARLGARAWISAHDGAKEVAGLGTVMLRTKRWGLGEVEDAVRGMEELVEKERRGQRARPEARMGAPRQKTKMLAGRGSRWWLRGKETAEKLDETGACETSKKPVTEDEVAKTRKLRTRVMALGVGEEAVLTSEGVWDSEAISPTRDSAIGVETSI